MKLAWPKRFEQRLTVLAWVGALVLLGLGAGLGVRNEVSYRQQLGRQIAAQGDILAASVTAALAFDDTASMQQYVAALKANPMIAAAAVYDVRGTPLVTMDRFGAPPPPRQPGPVRMTWRRLRIQVVRPAAEKGQTLGYVFLETRADSWPAVLSRHVGVALLTLMSVLLLTLVSLAAWRVQTRTVELARSNARLTEEMAARATVEEALRQSQKMEALGQLTGGIAHDFNNLLQVIMGALELIRRKPADTGKVGVWAQNALEAAERGATLTRQLLAFSRTQKLDLRPFIVSDLVEGMRELLIRTLGPGIDLVMQLDSNGPPVLSDRTQLELAILNLAINARDAMPNGGRLTVRTEVVTIGPDDPLLTPDRYVALSVSDTGEGMPSEVVARAFDPFFTTKAMGKGTGLGLSQVYGVARQAGGEARIASRPGEGTTVTVLLRSAAPDARPEAATSGSEAVLAPAKGATVLVVDDETRVRELLDDTLQLLGYRVLTADGGPAAIALLQRERPDAMLVDFAMPQMNGAQVADRARRLWPDLPIVFASGHADTGAIKAAVGEDAEILRKPFDMNDLARILGATLQRSQPAEI